MALRGFIFGLVAASALTYTHLPVAAQQSTPVPNQIPTEIPTGLPTELTTEQRARQEQAPRTAGRGAVPTRILAEGCIERAQRNGSVGGTGVGTTSTPSTADDDANSSDTLDVFQLNNAHAIPKQQTSGTGRTTYGLEGHEREVAPHIGHRVQISGTLAAERATGTARAAAAGIRRIRVESIKMVSTTCEADTAR